MAAVHARGEVSRSGPGLEYLLGTFGPFEGVRRILRGSGEWGAVDYTLLGLSLPHWTLLAFIVFTAWFLVMAFRERVRAAAG